MSPEHLALIADTGEVLIETHGGGRTYTTVIWVAVDGDDVFVRSVRGEAGRWYRRTLDDPEVALLVGGTRIPLRAVSATDPESVERASQGFRSKYPRSRSLDSMLRDEVLGTTLLLEPR